jgi:hypothetical protein
MNTKLETMRTISLVICIGSVLFLVAALLPYSRVFAEPVAERKMEIITSMRGQWNVAQILFGLGSIVTVIGLGLMVMGFKETSLKSLAYTAIILMITGALLWSWSVTERIISPEGFVTGNNTPYLFLIYSILTQVGLFLIGFFMLKTAVANWLGWMFIIGSLLLFILMGIFRDMPPFVYYVLTLVLAISLLSGRVLA